MRRGTGEFVRARGRTPDRVRATAALRTRTRLCGKTNEIIKICPTLESARRHISLDEPRNNSESNAAESALSVLIGEKKVESKFCYATTRVNRDVIYPWGRR